MRLTSWVVRCFRSVSFAREAIKSARDADSRPRNEAPCCLVEEVSGKPVVRGNYKFCPGGRLRGLVNGKRWLLPTRWVNLTSGNRQQLNSLFALDRKLLEAYLLKESLDRLWNYHYEGALLNYLQRRTDQLRWQRLRPFLKLAEMLLKHLDGILTHCRTKVPMGVVESGEDPKVTH